MQKKELPRLRLKFLKEFFIPLFIGIIVSIIFSVGVLGYFSQNYFKKKTITKEMNLLFDKDNLAKVKSFIQLLYSEVQGDITKLEKLRDTYSFLHNEKLIDMSNSFKNQITNNIFNVFEASDNNKETNSLDYGRWFIDKTIKNYTDIDSIPDTSIKETTLSQLSTITHLLILLRAISESDHETEYEKINFIFFFESTNLYFEYPYNKDSSLFSKAMPQWCTDTNNITPDYYYFRCTEYYKKYQEFFLKYNDHIISIGDVYSKNNDFMYPICLKAAEPIYNQTTPQPTENNFLICYISPITKLWKQLDEFNTMFQGYFFIYTVNNKVPFYYPKSIRSQFIDDIKRDEFYLNATYFIDELVYYSQQEQLFSKRLESPIIFNFTKNKQQMVCNIKPLNYYLNYDNQIMKSFHYQSIIQFSNMNISDQYDEIISSWNNKNICQGLILGIVGLVLIIFIIYMIIGLADCIVRPIKNIKKILKEINKKKSEPNDLTSLNTKNTTGNELEQEDLNEQQHFVTNNKDNDDEDEKVEEVNEEDDYITTRSADVNMIFFKLVDLKNSLEAVSNETLSFDDGNLTNYIFAQNTFKQLQKNSAKCLCDSNIGNLLLQSKQYDKAIFHLTEANQSIFHPTNNFNLLNITSIESELEKRIKDKSIEVKETDIKKLLDSRLPKLLYAYSRYFKSLNKLKKGPMPEKVTLLQSNDISSLISIDSYEKELLIYVEIAFKHGDKYNIKIALLEYLNYILDYKIHPNDDSKTVEGNIAVVFKIFNLLKVPENNKSKDETLEVNQLMMLIQNLKLELNVVEQIKIPQSILNQRLSYLQGKFYLLSCQYITALNYFANALQVDLVSDAKLVVLSLKKIIEIAEKYIQLITSNYFDLNNNRLLNYIDDLNYFIRKKQDQISMITFYSKDICIIIMNITHLMKAYEILENLVSEYDRITIVYYDEKEKQIKILLRLSNKNDINVEDIRNYFKKIEDDYMNTSSFVLKVMIQNISEEPKKGEKINSFEELLTWTRNYLYKKSSNSQAREKWFIFLKTSFNDEEIKYIQSNQLHSKLYWGSSWYNLIFVLMEKTNLKKMPLERTQTFNLIDESHNFDLEKMKDNEEKIIKHLTFNKSGIITNDMIDGLQEKMIIKGKIHQKHEFPQEKYEDVKESLNY